VRDAAKRIVTLVGVLAGLTAVVSLAVGALLGSELARALATGFYVVGCFLIVLGFFAGVRGPLRPRSSGDGEERDAVGGLFGIGVSSRGVRRATSAERADALATAWLFLAIGLALIALGILADPRVGFV
jgi:drug/metabolite transporter (DMT)-like permease